MSIYGSQPVLFLFWLLRVPLGRSLALGAPSTTRLDSLGAARENSTNNHLPQGILNSSKMSKAAQPELKKYMDKKLFINLQGNRKLSGVLRGFDIFLNLVLDEAQEENLEGGEKRKMGLVVIRGNSVSSIETLEAVR
ncbi:hypothetical protein O181_057073 [Austropuccinia psidii MF-1]|uniref:Small nuclear ribonucleoprotein G n=1 Tax=Austropuccinia psidii MF-1 TaxID=1389203 RepID=A0A9Q3HU42_9BASI|nr:hypothetical protein [Austropuccinia psidii MF-1]